MPTFGIVKEEILKTQNYSFAILLKLWTQCIGLIGFFPLTCINIKICFSIFLFLTMDVLIL